MFIRWIIPDVPRKLSERMRQEAYLTNEIIIKQEMMRARGARGIQGDATAWVPRPRSYVEPPLRPIYDDVALQRSKSASSKISPVSKVVSV